MKVKTGVKAGLASRPGVFGIAHVDVHIYF
jgi:hypothetical protein